MQLVRLDLIKIGFDRTGLQIKLIIFVIRIINRICQIMKQQNTHICQSSIDQSEQKINKRESQIQQYQRSSQSFNKKANQCNQFRKQGEIEISNHYNFDESQYKITRKDEINYAQYQDRNLRQKEQCKPQWDSRTNPKKQPDLQQQLRKRPSIKSSTKQSNKQNVCINTNESISQRNKQWAQNRDKKIFEKARTSFMRAKELCFFGSERK